MTLVVQGIARNDVTLHHSRVSLIGRRALHSRFRFGRTCISVTCEAVRTLMPDTPDIETVLLGPVLADRSCGDCVACCTVLTVDTPDFKKPAGVPCAHLCSQGCAIHEVRPHICRTWFCGWRRVAAMPQDARPDRSGLIVSLSFERNPRNCFEGVSINVRAIDGGPMIDSGSVRAILDSVCNQLVAVWFSDGDQKMLMHPDDAIARLVISGDPAPAHLQGEVDAWRERYGAFL